MTTYAPSISVSREIDAPAHRLFEFLSRPSHHADIDGSGMLRGTDDSRVLSGVGDVFEMRMFNTGQRSDARWVGSWQPCPEAALG